MEGGFDMPAFSEYSQMIGNNQGSQMESEQLSYYQNMEESKHVEPKNNANRSEVKIVLF